jgi:hypothetical protein
MLRLQRAHRHVHAGLADPGEIQPAAARGVGDAAGQELKYSWARDIPRYIVENVIREFAGEYNIIHARREDQPAFDGTFSVTDNFKGMAVLCEMSEKRFFMDSFLQHTAAALNKPSTVCWVSNRLSLGCSTN